MNRLVALSSLSLVALLSAAAGGPSMVAAGQDVEVDAEVEIRLSLVQQVKAELRATPLTGMLRFVAVDGTADPLVHALAAGDAPPRVTLPPGSWRVMGDLQDHWFPSHLLQVKTPPARQVENIRVWATGRVEGRVRMADPAEPLPGELVMWIRSPERFQVVGGKPAAPREAAVPVAQVPCTVGAEGHFGCALPATDLDLVVRAKGFVPHYRWGADIAQAGALSLGTLLLERGASVAGSVATAEGELQPSACKVHLERMAAGGGDPRAATRLRSTALRGSVDARGFFQLDGVPPGTYKLIVEQPGYAPGTVMPLEVWQDAETQLRDPVLLHRPAELALTLEPPTDWRGEPWRVELLRALDGGAGVEPQPAFAGSVDAMGQALVRALTPGRFLLFIADGAGNAMHSEPFLEIAASGRMEHRVEIETVALTGTLTLGDTPLAAALWFGGRHGAVSVSMPTDEEGAFGGVLPREGAWRVEIRAAEPRIETEVVAEVEMGSDGVAVVDLVLPDTEIFGRVVDGDDRPLSDAHVRGSVLGRSTAVHTDADGAFTLRGVEPGLLALSARLETAAETKVSRTRLLSIREELAVGPIELRVEGLKPFAGEVVSPRGPVVGAGVSAATKLPRSLSYGDHGQTGLDGRFALEIPDGTREVQVLVSPPGHTLRVFSVAASEQPARLEVFPEGGVLEIAIPTVEADRAAASTSQLVVLQDGEAVPLQWLLRWARANGVVWDPTTPGVPIVIPQLAPASYRVCYERMARLAEAAARTGAWEDGLGACQEGYLAPGAVLRFDLSAG